MGEVGVVRYFVRWERCEFCMEQPNHHFSGSVFFPVNPLGALVRYRFPPLLCLYFYLSAHVNALQRLSVK